MLNVSSLLQVASDEMTFFLYFFASTNFPSSDYVYPIGPYVLNECILYYVGFSTNLA